jgi:two-component system OmpR family sensor kinase
MHSSLLRRYRPEAMWALFAVMNVQVMFMLDHWQTVPFHFIWVSLTILYGFRLWRPWPTAIILAAVMVTTGAALAHEAFAHHHGVDEMTEVPLMAAMFLAMVWHARRRQVAVDALAEASARERDRLEAITARLLTLAAAEQRGALVRAPVDVRRLVLQTLNRWSATADRDWGCGSRVAGTVQADAARLTTALDALVENAVAATRDADPITLSCRAAGDTLQIEVRDGGRGIAADDLDRVFERFARVVPADAAAAEGTGLGLAIVKAIAEAHGGGVAVTSRPGEGTAFVLSLPRFSADAPPAPTAERVRSAA